MNFKAIWTNYKIYAFFLGVILGTLIYNFLGIDFSFENVQRVELINYFDSYIYILSHNLRFWVLIFVLSFFRMKDKILLLIIFYYSFLIAGIITVSLNSHTTLLIHGSIIAMVKIFGAVFMFDDTKRVRGRIISFAMLIVGSFLEIFFVQLF